MLPDYENNNYQAIAEWQKQPDGFWKKKTGHIVKRNTKASGTIISFDKNSKLLYTYDDKGIYKIELQKEWVAYYKLQAVEEKASLLEELKRVEDMLDSKYNGLNERLQQSIDEKKRQSEEDAQKKLEEYKIDHPNWYKLPIKTFFTNCLLCGKKEADLVYCMSNDTIYTTSIENNILNEMCFQIHVFPMDEHVKNTLATHIAIYKDSLTKKDYSLSKAVEFNKKEKLRFTESIQKKAPYGFVSYHGWSLNTANGVEPYFSFMNLSKKTIKYVDLYFCLYNAVGDKCKLIYDNSYTGKLRGVGPVEQFDEGYWHWDRATHYTTGDASEMKITKVVITYMDKSVRTLVGNALIIK
jgi:hypothetical protein